MFFDATGLIKRKNHLYLHRNPFILLGKEKQLQLHVSVLLKDTSTIVTAGIRTHILMTQSSEHKSDAHWPWHPIEPGLNPHSDPR